MIFLYQIAIRLFLAGTFFASFFNRKARLWIDGRKNIFKRLVLLFPVSNGERKEEEQIIWFHCSSLGEFEQARPLIEKIKNQKIKNKILITFFSPSGYEVRKNYEGADYIFYLPLDTKTNAQKFISLLKPAAAFFIKYDFWYNYLNELHQQKIPTYLISANFRQEQFNGLYGNFLNKVLLFFTHIFVQNESSQKILNAEGFLNVTISGDLRYDRVSDTITNPKQFPLIEQFKGSSKLIVAGSTWEKDEKIIGKLQIANCKLIIAPHEIGESDIRRVLAQFPDRCIRYSELSKENFQTINVLVIDNIGMLSSLYQYADIAYIGGGFGSGIHNILEAVAFGVPVIFGPNHHKFPEANELIELGGAFIISDIEKCNKVVDLLFSDDKILKMASFVCKKFVKEKRGVVEKIVSSLLKIT
ncbi:MAG: glycosyltransferase N-terminal domain-containing protein [Bacteroidota bacterium]